MAVNPHPAARPAALKAFASTHPGWSFDEAGMTLSAPPASLFEKGTDALTPDAARGLKDLAAELSGAGADGLVAGGRRPRRRPAAGRRRGVRPGPDGRTSPRPRAGSSAAAACRAGPRPARDRRRASTPPASASCPRPLATGAGSSPDRRSAEADPVNGGVTAARRRGHRRSLDRRSAPAGCRRRRWQVEIRIEVGPKTDARLRACPEPRRGL